MHRQDYVIVLLRNGRGKDHAKNKLNVFLGIPVILLYPGKC
jgi:hypothetical protein